MNQETGIKFNLELRDESLPRDEEIVLLQIWRRELYQRGLMGVKPDGVGYGNISVRSGDSFIISGTMTGSLPELAPVHYARVLSFSIADNSVTASGKTKPSSEALTHAACYCGNPSINGVVHVHHKVLWESLIRREVFIKAECLYGSPELARELSGFAGRMGGDSQLIAMAGHEDGIVAIGKTLDGAANLLLDAVDREA